MPVIADSDSESSTLMIWTVKQCFLQKSSLLFWAEKCSEGQKGISEVWNLLTLVVVVGDPLHHLLFNFPEHFMQCSWVFVHIDKVSILVDHI